MIAELLIGILSVILVIYFLVFNCMKPEGYPPGPVWWPLIGCSSELRHLSQKLGGQHMALAQLFEQYGSNILGLKLGNEKVIAVSSYPIIKKVMTSEAYNGRPKNFFIKLRTMGTEKGVTSTDGPLWKEHRSFIITHLKNLGFGKRVMEIMVQKEIQEIMGTIEKNMDSLSLEEVLSPAVLTVLWTLTSGSRLVTNARLKNLLEILEKRSKAFDMSGGMLTSYPWLRYIMPEKTGYNLVQTLNTKLKEFVMETINKHKETWTENNREDLIYSFLTEMHARKDDDESTFTDDQLVMVCLDIFLAGSHTTSNTANFCFVMMILYPEVQKKVQICLDATFQKNEEIVYSDRQKVPYIEAVLLEVQRFCPVVPISAPRRALRNTKLEGYSIPQGATVLISLYSTHCDKEYWKDPEVFRPERFLDREGNLIPYDQFNPFGLGKRRCPGDVLAKTCIFLFFVEILRKYTVKAKIGTKLTGKQLPGMLISPEKYEARFVRR